MAAATPLLTATALPCRMEEETISSPGRAQSLSRSRVESVGASSDTITCNLPGGYSSSWQFLIFRTTLRASLCMAITRLAVGS